MYEKKSHCPPIDSVDKALHVTHTPYIAFFAAAFLIVALLPASCHPFNVSLKPDSNTTVTISGTITTSDNCSAAGALVQLKQGGANVGDPVRAGTGGVYIISGVVPGNFTITASLGGYNPGTRGVSVSNTNVTGQNLMLNRIIKLNIGTSYTGPYTVDADGTTLRSITTSAGKILIGRSITDNVTLNINASGSLEFRSGSLIPIGSYAEFQLINSNSTTLDGDYKQEADLDLMNLPWDPVGTDSDKFTGTFDGNNKGISNLRINISGTDPAGLFGNVEGTGTVKKVHIRSGSVSGAGKAGGIAATNSGTVEACSNAAAVSGGTDTGGIAGNNGGTITACYNTGAVSGSGNTGGVVGNNGGPIIACYNTGAVSGGTDTGGVVGDNVGPITACYNTGAVLGSVNTGGVVGNASGGTVAANYWLDVADDAANGVGNPASNTGAAKFDSTWLTTGTHTEWGTGDGSGSGKYWKSLGGWYGGNPIYPKLWYEQ
jgi:hypothetical protein